MFEAITPKVHDNKWGRSFSWKRWFLIMVWSQGPLPTKMAKSKPWKTYDFEAIEFENVSWVLFRNSTFNFRIRFWKPSVMKSIAFSNVCNFRNVYGPRGPKKGQEWGPGRIGGIIFRVLISNLDFWIRNLNCRSHRLLDSFWNLMLLSSIQNHKSHGFEITCCIQISFFMQKSVASTLKWSHWILTWAPTPHDKFKE